MPSFNLIDQPFIPCVTPAGEVEYVGIRAALRRAHEFAELRDPSPVVTIALHRLLLAVLHAAIHGPVDSTAWRKLWDAGAFDSAVIDRYLATWRDRFDLFHETHPFFQDAAYRAKEMGGSNLLVRELSRGHNATLFDHTHESPPPAIPAALAARGVIAEQGFAISAGKSELGHTKTSPAAVGVLLLVRGPTLFQTLVLNLIQYPPDDDDEDRPAWERDTRPTADAPTPDGHLDYLTWQARTIRLHSGENDTVREVSFAQGREFTPPEGTVFDPMTTYRASQGEAFRPVRLSEDKDLWRDSAAFFEFENVEGRVEDTHPPVVLTWLRKLRTSQTLPEGSFSLSAFGLCTDQAKVNFWRHDTFPLPLQYLTDENLVATLREAIALAEEVGKTIREAAAEVAKLILTGGADRKPDDKRKWQMVDAMAADAVYYSRLGEPFRRLMSTLPKGNEGDAALTHRREQMKRWFYQTLTKEAGDAFKQTVWQAADRVREDRAAVAGENQLRSRLAALARRHRLTDDPEPKEATK